MVSMGIKMKCNKFFRFFILAILTIGELVSNTVLAQQQPANLSFGYENVRFDRDIDPWNLYYLSLSKKTEAGSLTGRVNQAQRFGETGYQGEINFYPSIGEGKYFYLNVGYSNSGVFPRWRTGAEYFQSLPASTEISLGFRLLQFSGEPVKIFTGSISKYWGSYLFTLRPYYVPNSSGGSLSGALTARYYLNDEEYLSLTAGSGVATTTDVNLQFFEQHSQKIGIDGNFRISNSAFVSPGYSVQWFEFFPGIYRRQESYSLSFQFPF